MEQIDLLLCPLGKQTGALVAREDFLTMGDSSPRTWSLSRAVTHSLADVLSRHTGQPLVPRDSSWSDASSLPSDQMCVSVCELTLTKASHPCYPLECRHRFEEVWFLMDTYSGTFTLECFLPPPFAPALPPVMSLYTREVLAPVGKNERRKQPFMEEAKMFQKKNL